MQLLIESHENLEDTKYNQKNIKHQWKVLLKYYEQEIEKDFNLFVKAGDMQDKKKEKASDNYTFLLAQRIEIVTNLLLHLELKYFAKLPELMIAYEQNPVEMDVIIAKTVKQ